MRFPEQLDVAYPLESPASRSEPCIPSRQHEHMHDAADQIMFAAP